MKKYFIPLWIILIAIISIVTLRAVSPISDIPPRVSFILAHQAGTADLPSNFLYYWMIEFFSFFSTNSSFISNTIVYFAFPLFFIFRFLATLVLGRYFFTETLKSLSAKNAIQIEIISFLLLFAHAIPIFYFLQMGNTFFLGYLSGTVWHNETIMSTMVFAVFTYLFMLKQLKDLDNIKRITTLSIILVIGILLKPSFFFSMGPSFGLFLLFAIFKKTLPLNQKIRQLFMNSIPLLCGGLTIGLLMIYQNTHLHPAAGGEILKTHFSFDPIVWKAFQPNSLVLATIFSYLFPISFFFFNINKTYKDSNLLFVWCNALVAILIFSFVYLVPGTYAGDMGWQIIPASYLLFCTSSFLFFSNFKWNIKNIFLLIFFSTHILCGIYYIYRISVDLGCV